MKNAGVIGASLVVSYTFFIAAADGLTKKLTTLVAALQMYAISGAVVVGLCITTAYGTSKWQSLRTTCKFAMALRSAATISAALLFFQSFRLLPFADVFIFIGMMPLLAGPMAAPVLGERVSPASWAAVSLGLIGAWCLFPAGLDSATAGHALAMLAALAGTFSIVLSRYISQHENNSLAQVFYPNLCMLLVMLVALPQTWQPMSAKGLALSTSYGVLFFSRAGFWSKLSGYYRRMSSQPS